MHNQSLTDIKSCNKCGQPIRLIHLLNSAEDGGGHGKWCPIEVDEFIATPTVDGERYIDTSGTVFTGIKVHYEPPPDTAFMSKRKRQELGIADLPNTVRQPVYYAYAPHECRKHE
ncbi:hypothetical protein FACS18949_11850 [Clostridia bacterium]|nr:hypothetical protein FACS18949_11850 [Clostridia bacterium]